MLFSAFILLTTCQLQFNKSAGNNLALQIVAPESLPDGGNSSDGKSLTNGTSVTVKISEEGTAFSTQQSVPIAGQTDVDVSFSLSSSGTYDVSATIQDASGYTFAKTTAKLTVPTGNYPVVLPMYSSLLSGAVVTDASSGVNIPLTPTFSPTQYSYTGYLFGNAHLALTAADSSATITVTQQGIAISPIAGFYLIQNSGYPADVSVTAQNGTISTLYAMNLTAF